MCPACYRLAAVTAGMRAPIASRLVALLLTVAITAAVFVVYVSETSIYALWTDAESLKEDKLPPFPHSSHLYGFPQALIVGVQKCGTSALYFSLCQHPQIECAAYFKEPFYLNRLVLSEMETDAQGRFTAGRREAAHSAYLRSVFNVTALRPGMNTIEASTTYFSSEAARVAAGRLLVNGEAMKIIVILREPITRAYSLYNHARRHGKSGVPDTFADAVRDEAQALMFCREQDEGRMLEDGAVYNETYDYELYYRCIAEEEARLKSRGHYMLLLQGLYYYQLLPWLHDFPGRVLVLMHNELREHPVQSLDVVQKFLRLPYFDYNTVIDQVAHEYQEGSRYDPLGGTLIHQLADEFRVHNDLLSLVLGYDVGWNAKLHDAHYIIPV